MNQNNPFNIAELIDNHHQRHHGAPSGFAEHHPPGGYLPQQPQILPEQHNHRHHGAPGAFLPHQPPGRFFEHHHSGGYHPQQPQHGSDEFTEHYHPADSSRPHQQHYVAISIEDQKKIQQFFIQVAGVDREIDRQEFKHVLMLIKPDLRNNANLAQLSESLFRQIDKNNSGYINWNEFIAGYISLHHQLNSI